MQVRGILFYFLSFPGTIMCIGAVNERMCNVCPKWFLLSPEYGPWNMYLFDRWQAPTVLDLKWHDNYFHKQAICIAYNQSLRFIIIFRVVSIVCYFTSYNSYHVICMFTLQNVQHKESNITPCHWRSENITIRSGFSGARKTIVWLDSYEIL